MLTDVDERFSVISAKIIAIVFDKPCAKAAVIVTAIGARRDQLDGQDSKAEHVLLLPLR
jgi:hypothetical protein